MHHPRSTTKTWRSITSALTAIGIALLWQTASHAESPPPDAKRVAKHVAPERVATERHVDDPILRVVSYNIKHGRGMDGKVDLDRTAKVLAKLKPDIIALQEVDKHCTRSGKVDIAAELGKRLKMDHRFGKFMDFQGGEYGMAVLSRLPIKTTRIHKLPRGAEPRIALEVVVQANSEAKDADKQAAPKKAKGLGRGGGIKKQQGDKGDAGDAGNRASRNEDGNEHPLPDFTFSFVCIHNDWTTASRRFQQVEALIKSLSKRPKHEGKPLPTLLVGDFNCGPRGVSLQPLVKDGWRYIPKDDKSRRATFPSPKPTIEIDYVITRDLPFAEVSHQVIDERVASDHRPLLAVFRFAQPSSKD